MVVALALCGATDGASADEKSGSTVVITKAHVIQTGNPTFPEATEVKGKVKSGEKKCRKNRQGVGRLLPEHDAARAPRTSCSAATRATSTAGGASPSSSGRTGSTPC